MLQRVSRHAERCFIMVMMMMVHTDDGGGDDDDDADDDTSHEYEDRQRDGAWAEKQNKWHPCRLNDDKCGFGGAKASSAPPSEWYT